MKPISGGYFITRAVERSSHNSADLIPAQVLSASECICPTLPEIWAFEWAGVEEDERRAAAAVFGIGEASLAEVARWVTERHNDNRVGFCNVFTTIDDAREFAETFLKRGELPLVLAGIGLHPEDAQTLRAESAPGADEGAPGVYACLDAGQPIADGGTRLGWEPLCYEHGGFHSWLCNGLEKATFEKLGTRPNEHGFIDDGDAARDVATYCGSDEVGAEPGLWQAWSYTMYPF